MTTKDREHYLYAAGRERIPIDAARRLASLGATYARLALAACNGDYPHDNGQRETRACGECEGLWAPESFRKGVCPSCHIKRRIIDAALPLTTVTSVNFSGDPRGFTVRLVTVTGSEIGVA